MSEPRLPGPTTPEWGTFALILGCYTLWLALLFVPLPFWLTGPLLALVLALHSSLTHEVLHGHPFRARALNEALMALPLTLLIPYGRFRDLHLAHHLDARLTDPYDDPESNYLDPGVWAGLPRWQRAVYAANNTLLGRILLGPAIGQLQFMAEDWRRRDERAVWGAWALHLAGLAAVLWVVARSPLPLWIYLAAAYGALGVLKIRTFLEHRAHEHARARTVIVEDRGPLAFLFLNNNLHVVHHMHPKAPWYRLPALYRAGRARYLACNGQYVYRSYGEVLRRYLLRPKDPVAHPLFRAR
ncbi:fatty acid desaturase [Antarcticimicrobium luteum]|uniref:Fatty acid desaturase n=1 Tax=Antarcticimicrobium luteum TaxID=2547397 RepID=A0A4V3AS26_9RHOB|nr:fatty acid desaturase [Antarcticimicrobium luteum]TDK48757.1 fatty acid desaturase [Antarcticimicrobium luteum]